MLCLKQSMKNALLNSKVFVFVFFFKLDLLSTEYKKMCDFLLFECALQISSMYKFTASTKLGYKPPSALLMSIFVS